MGGVGAANLPALDENSSDYEDYNSKDEETIQTDIKEPGIFLFVCLLNIVSQIIDNLSEILLS